MAESDHQLSICLITAMDHLWFHHIILLSEPGTPLLLPKIHLKTHSPAPNHSLLSTPLDIQDQEKSSALSPVSSLVEDSNDEVKEKEVNLKERPTRLKSVTGRFRSYSSSPSTQKGPRNLRRSGSTIVLRKSMSCKRLWDLELEEVKGFMDLGFIFKKENLSPQMISVIPGLQRVESYKNKHYNSRKPEIDAAEIAKDDEIEEEEYEHEKGIMRPYLSEAWLIKRSDSPLLSLKIPRVIAAADMKKHLRFWAKTVASEVQQEC